MRYLTLSSLLAVACAGPTAIAAADIEVGGMADVKDCRSVGVIEERIEAPTPREGLAGQVRAEIRERAAKLRASHLVYTAEESDASYAFARAEAYRCKSR